MYELENKTKQNYMDRGTRTRRSVSSYHRGRRNNEKKINSFHIYLIQILFCLVAIGLVVFLKQLNNEQVNNKLNDLKGTIDQNIDQETLNNGVKKVTDTAQEVWNRIRFQGAGGGMFDLNFDPGTIQNTSDDLQFSDAYLSDSIINPVDNSILTSSYGLRTHPVRGTPDFHTGIDLAQAKGVPIKAALKGTVTEAGYSESYGNYITLSHEGSETFYGHCDSLNVKVGQQVNQGDKIATVGSTGVSTGPHLHFEVKVNGTRVDPMNFIKLKKQ